MTNYEKRIDTIIKIIEEWDNVEYRLVTLPNNHFDIGFNIKRMDGIETIPYDPEIVRLFSKIILHESINQSIASMTEYLLKDVEISKIER